uniref:Uncharacterized protein n=1 Tax=Anguilla anguilla TaxID=7936 RepID=A0A0E9XJA9_ANGAN
MSECYLFSLISCVLCIYYRGHGVMGNIYVLSLWIGYG